MKRGILKFLAVAMLFDNAEGGGGGGVIVRPDNISEDEWEGLSQEEREGVLMTGEGEQGHLADDGEDSGEEFSEEELAAIAAVDTEDAEKNKAIKDATEQAAGATETPAEGDAGAASGTEEQPGTASTPEELPTDEDLLAWRPVVSDSEVPLSNEVPEELQEKLDALDTQLDEAEKWFDAGEKADGTPFTRSDLNKLNREIAKERDSVNREVIQFQFQQRDVAKEDLSWKKSQSAFIAARPEYKEMEADGKTFTVRSEALFGALSQQVKRLNSDPKNASKSDMQILVEADRAVRQAFNLPLPGKKAAAATPEKPKAPEPKPPAGRPDIKTLATVPKSAAEVAGDPFAALDRLTGEAYERALERLSPEQRAEYEKRA